MTVLSASGLRKDYGKGDGLVHAVRDVDLHVAEGETVAVMGPSGCGKSTLLHLLGGLDRPDAGRIHLAGMRLDLLSERGLAGVRRDAVGFVFQAFHLMDELTAVENVELPALLVAHHLGDCAGRAPFRSPDPCARRDFCAGQRRPAVAQMLPALGGAIVGVPAGLLLFAAVRNGGAMAYPPDWWLACVVIATPLVVGALTIVPSRLASRAGVAPILQAEAA
jgi:ABC-type branched-subunit amino acid transport system ATPase component